MGYVDGFVAAVPNDNKEAYREHALKSIEVFKRHGALSCVECWADDTPDGEVTSFPMAVRKKPDESVVFAWVVWPDKATRDAGMQKVFEDPDMSKETNPMPFDGQRLIYGGFEVIVDA